MEHGSGLWLSSAQPLSLRTAPSNQRSRSSKHGFTAQLLFPNVLSSSTICTEPALWAGMCVLSARFSIFDAMLAILTQSRADYLVGSCCHVHTAKQWPCCGRMAAAIVATEAPVTSIHRVRCAAAAVYCDAELVDLGGRVWQYSSPISISCIVISKTRCL